MRMTKNIQCENKESTSNASTVFYFDILCFVSPSYHFPALFLVSFISSQKIQEKAVSSSQQCSFKKKEIVSARISSQDLDRVKVLRLISFALIIRSWLHLSICVTGS